MPAASEADAVSPATRQSNFEQGVALALHLWPDLTLAVQNHWGGPDSEDKRDWFAGAVVDLFPDLSKPSTAAAPSQDEPDTAYVEEFLLQVMVDEFEVNVDDDSSLEVAEQIIRVRNGCVNGNFEEVDTLRRRFESRKGSKVSFQKGEDEEVEASDWDTDEEEDGDDDASDGDVEMGDAPPREPAKKERQEPHVDEDGFTTVTRKKR
ncbi:hypothetical protein VTK73DRAFT_2236 [Phialemonium thermophilum]|uniref:Pre-rRNA-processing protein TSR2 n=1 Tax=Phialemonium thermophilum TaxID=223376 RepID=A0ABR3X6B0_9PEZI